MESLPAEEVMEFEDGSGSDSFWFLRRLLDLDRFCFSPRALRGGGWLVGVLREVFCGRFVRLWQWFVWRCFVWLRLPLWLLCGSVVAPFGCCLCVAVFCCCRFSLRRLASKISLCVALVGFSVGNRGGGLV